MKNATLTTTTGLIALAALAAGTTAFAQSASYYHPGTCGTETTSHDYVMTNPVTGQPQSWLIHVRPTVKPAANMQPCMPGASLQPKQQEPSCKPVEPTCPSPVVATDTRSGYIYGRFNHGSDTPTATSGRSDTPLNRFGTRPVDSAGSAGPELTDAQGLAELNSLDPATREQMNSISESIQAGRPVILGSLRSKLAKWWFNYMEALSADNQIDGWITSPHHWPLDETDVRLMIRNQITLLTPEAKKKLIERLKERRDKKIKQAKDYTAAGDTQHATMAQDQANAFDQAIDEIQQSIK